MAGPTVYDGVVEELALDGVGQLFAGKKFWVAQRVPNRTALLDNIKDNGGEIVLLEKKADYKIADHFRRDCPPGSISYEFVSKSIDDGRLRDPEDHRAGPPESEARAPGDLTRPAKTGRVNYTPEEDRICYKWVRDCVANGGSAHGNEIYKQLEAQVRAARRPLSRHSTDQSQYPRHTWQSWRDHYIKQLQNRPPSAFNIPDNAPPSPPSEAPAGPAQRATAAARSTSKAAAPPEQSHVPKKVTGKGRVRDSRPNVPPEYTLEQLAATFTADDWEELYAFVDVIDAMKDKEDYGKAWRQWATSQDNQTADQWRQYYEKVVYPQWLRDPEWKRVQVKQKVEKRHESDSSQIQPDEEPQRGNAQEEAPVAEVVTTVPKTSKVTAEAPRPRGSMQSKAAAEPSKLSSEVKLMSSSTAKHESPKYISALQQNTLKRTRRDDNEPEEQPLRGAQGQSPPAKRQRSLTPVAKVGTVDAIPTGTDKRPVEILSSDSSDSGSQAEAEDEEVNYQIIQDVEQSQLNRHVKVDLEEVDQEIDSIESDDIMEFEQSPPLPEGLEQPSEDDFPSNTPTPRAPRQRSNNFDTQAILSSPSQGMGISKLPRPIDFTQAQDTQSEHRSSSLVPNLDSDASTTQSLQEFRRSLNGENATQPSYSTLVPLSRAPSYSPALSNSSTTSGDPDLPLAADEMEDFFAEQKALGHTDDFIVAALKRTRCRPGLAEIVLDAWSEGKPLPNQRGIWSLEDDEVAESGDGLELAKLERKHTLDGWGGITERLRFLEGYRSGRSP
jgi:hypothetical protein